jgi:hypothetical protein
MSEYTTLENLEEYGHVGDWCFVETQERLYMFLRYPVKDSRLGDLPVEEQHGDIVNLPLSGDNSKPVWGWNGDRQYPTLSPSINVIGRWHGYLRNGKLETL